MSSPCSTSQGGKNIRKKGPYGLSFITGRVKIYRADALVTDDRGFRERRARCKTINKKILTAKIAEYLWQALEAPWY